MGYTIKKIKNDNFYPVIPPSKEYMYFQALSANPITYAGLMFSRATSIERASRNIDRGPTCKHPARWAGGTRGSDHWLSIISHIQADNCQFVSVNRGQGPTTSLPVTHHHGL